MQTIKVKGMSCQHCRKSVTDALTAIEGLSQVEVSLERGEASFEAASEADVDRARQAVRDTGFETE